MPEEIDCDFCDSKDAKYITRIKFEKDTCNYELPGTILATEKYNLCETCNDRFLKAGFRGSGVSRPGRILVQHIELKDLVRIFVFGRKKGA